MYAFQQLRFHHVFYEIQTRLRDMALDPRGFPGIANEFRQLKSSASTPSLRSKDSELVPMTRTTSESGGGNVRVVVRVRGFLPRGMLARQLFHCIRLTNMQRSSEERNVL